MCVGVVSNVIDIQKSTFVIKSKVSFDVDHYQQYESFITIALNRLFVLRTVVLYYRILPLPVEIDDESSFPHLAVAE